MSRPQPKVHFGPDEQLELTRVGFSAPGPRCSGMSKATSSPHLQVRPLTWVCEAVQVQLM